MRHHNPARWLANDGLGNAAPDDFVQSRMMVGAHDDGVDFMGIRPASEHLADRAAAGVHRLEGCIYPVLLKVVDKIHSRLRDRLGLLVRHRDDADRGGGLKELQRITDRARRTRG